MEYLSVRHIRANQIGPLQPKESEFCVNSMPNCGFPLNQYRIEYRAMPLIVVSDLPALDWKTKFADKIKQEAELLTHSNQFLNGYKYKDSDFKSKV